MTALRAALDAGRLFRAPGAYDMFSARLVAQAGFEGVYMTGLGATASSLGLPDLGYMTGSEMVDHARRMVRAAGIPVIADADTGYGGVLNVDRTVRDYAQVGVAAIHLEDQALPKRCGQLAGVKLIEAADHAARLQAALRARGSADMLIIGRTDALGAVGMDEALARAKLYAAAGADLVFVDGVKTIGQAKTIAHELKGLRKVISLVDGNETAALTHRDVQELGFSVCFHAVTCLFAAQKGVSEALRALKETGESASQGARLATYTEFSAAVDLAASQEIDHRYHDR